MRILPVSPLQNVRVSKFPQAFSLIEVVFALAVFSFSILTLTGLMVTGLNSAGDSSRNLAMANIQRLMRANLDATAYVNITNTVAPSYFTAAGYPTVQNPGATSPDSPYFSVSYTTNSPSGSVASSGSAKVIQATIAYPYPANVRTNTFSLFIAQ